MAEITYGEVDWNSGDVSEGRGKTEFMRLEQGTSTVRIMGNPIQFYIHWADLPDGSKRKFNSPVSSPELVKRLDDAGFGRKPRWIVKVLDRSDDKFKLLEIGSQIYNGIRALYNNPKWGKVTEYDVDIIRAKPGTNPLYSIQPNPREKLDASFKDAFMQFNDSINLEMLTRPADPDEVMKLMGWAGGDSAKEADAFSSTDSGDDDFSFE